MTDKKKQNLFMVGFAIALGTFIGFFAINEFLNEVSPWLSPLGGLLAGVVAWVANDIRTILQAIPRAYRSTIESMKKTQVKMKSLHFNGKIMAKVFCYMFSYFFFFSLYFLLLPIAFGIPQNITINLLTGIFIFGVIAGSTAELFVSQHKGVNENSPIYKSAKDLGTYFFPPFILWKIFSNTMPFLGKFILKFSYKFYKLTHTEDRGICFIDSFVMTMVAYFSGLFFNSWIAGSPLVHALTFALLGFLLGVLDKAKVSPWILSPERKFSRSFS